MADKVCLQPCLGLRKEAVLCRQAFYVVHEDLRAGKTDAMYPVLAVEACDLDCATRLVDKKGKQAARTVRVPEMAKEFGIDLDSLPEGDNISPDHPAVQTLAKRVAELVDELLAAS